MNKRDQWESLMELAISCHEQGLYKEGIEKAQAALRLEEYIPPTDLAQILNNLASLYDSLGRYEEAEPLYVRALGINEQQLGRDHPVVAINSHNLASLYNSLRRYKEAEPLHVRALAINEQQLGRDHPVVAINLHNLASLYNSLGRYEEAEHFYLRSLEIDKHKLGSSDISVATSLNNLALSYESLGRYVEAERLLLKALAIREQQLGSSDISVANSLNNLALLYESLGRYGESESIYIRALGIYEQQLGKNCPDMVNSLNGLAGLYQSIGRYGEAERCLLRALEITEKQLGRNDLSLATSLNNLASLYDSLRRYEEAERLLLRALEIQEQQLGKDHGDVATSLNNLASLYDSLGRYGESERFYIKALKIDEQRLGSNHPSVAISLNNLASLYDSLGRYEEAKSYFVRALKIKKHQLGINHPSVANSLNNLAGVYYMQRQYGKALEYFHAALTCYYNHLRHEFTYIREQDHQHYLTNIKFTLELLLSFVYTHFKNDRAAIDIIFCAIVLTKALSATATATRNALLHSDRYPHLQPKINQIRNLIAQNNHLDYNDEDRKLREKNLDQIRVIDFEIAQAAPEIMLPDALTIDQKEIALQLPQNSTLIEFIRFDLYNLENDSWGDACYLAFIFHQSHPESIQMVDLGSTKDIDKLVKSFRPAIIADFKQLTTALPKPATIPLSTPIPIPLQPKIDVLEEIQEKLIAPLVPHLITSHIVIAPDGDLCHLPFHFLLPDRIVTYLTTGRDLLHTPSPKPPNRSIVVADPDFQQLPINPPGNSSIANASVQSATIQDLKFDPLPNFGILGKAIAYRLNAQAYYQAAATKAAITNSPCPQILSILTHGFALDATDNETDPMARSGLALSGADLDRSNLLLANEIATLDLHSNDLTILVACETALGEIKPGEGVYGLRRAFSIAGAKTTIATLWNIPVLASVILVEKFFDNLQIHKMGKGAALLEAQKYLRTRSQDELKQTQSGLDALDELKAAKYDLEGVTYPFAHPYFWAAWICLGETGAMESQLLELD
jgi:tetratricopeptide (TPR) repeat protein